jgi:hypothetical protein
MARKVINPKSTGSIVFATSEANLTSAPVAASDQVISFRIVAQPNLTGVPATYGAAASESAAASGFQVELSILQDWGATTSVSEFLFDNDGEEIWFQHDPAGSSEPTFKGAVYAVAGGWGGAADESWVDDLTFPCVAKPTYT